MWSGTCDVVSTYGGFKHGVINGFVDFLTGEEMCTYFHS